MREYSIKDMDEIRITPKGMGGSNTWNKASNQKENSTKHKYKPFSVEVLNDGLGIYNFPDQN